MIRASTVLPLHEGCFRSYEVMFIFFSVYVIFFLGYSPWPETESGGCNRSTRWCGSLEADSKEP
jgi:hypothetical protein